MIKPKQSLIISVVIIVIAIGAIAWYYNSTISGQAVSSSITECIDTDYGLNYFEKGKVLYRNNIFEDVCGRGDVLIERYCKQSLIDRKWHPATKSYKCRDGCEDGACIKGPISETMP